MKKTVHKSLADLLLEWYARHGRDLPWRQTRDPYRIWVAEIMLQQTQVDTVIPYYQRFLERFPTLFALASASQDEVLKAWENLGYYARARHLHAAAKVMVERFHGGVPDTLGELVGLPGIGRYTAGAILSTAFGQPVPALDGNARRVLSRVFAVQEPMHHARTQRRLWELAQAIVPRDGPGHFNQAVMDLGASLCTSRRPACHQCPVQETCAAHQRGLQEVLPMRRARRPVPHVQAAAGIIRDNGEKVLITQRPGVGLLGGLWKFPGGRREPGETLKGCLRGRIQEELGIQVRVGGRLASVDHAYTHFRMTLMAFHCVHLRGDPSARACARWRWASAHELDELAFSKAERKLIHALGERSRT